MTITTVAYPTAPAVEAPFGTLLDTATVVDGIDWQDGTAAFDSYNCMHFDAEAQFCAPNTKDFSQTAGWQNGFRFVAVGGTTCKAVGLDTNRMKSEVGRVFALGESTAVEHAFMKYRFVQSAANAGQSLAAGALWSAPVDLTPTGGAVKPALGVALLEAYARDTYAGMPTLHIPVVIASLLLGVQGAELDGTKIKTRLGSKMAVGAGYDYPNTSPTGTTATTGEKWLYATGEVLVQRGDLNVIQVMERSNNDVSVMAERPYIGTIDCFSAAVRVQVTA